MEEPRHTHLRADKLFSFIAENSDLLAEETNFYVLYIRVTFCWPLEKAFIPNPIGLVFLCTIWTPIKKKSSKQYRKGLIYSFKEIMVKSCFYFVYNIDEIWAAIVEKVPQKYEFNSNNFKVYFFPSRRIEGIELEKPYQLFK